MALSVLQLVGSVVDDFHAELSTLYARGCAAALGAHHALHVAYVCPDGAWRFPLDLDERSLVGAEVMPLAAALNRLSAMDVDVVVPQMFCRPGMTTFRSLLDLLGLAYLGNRPQVMANSADKAVARSLVAAAGVAVPRGQLVRDAHQVTLPFPLVVKPAGADNSFGVTLVSRSAALDAAIAAAAKFHPDILVESFVTPGREVRCGVLDRDGELVCLPLEEYPVGAAGAPIRRTSDKLRRATTGELTLAAKGAGRAWIVPTDDPITEVVWRCARACYRVLGCRHYGLFDFRIDDDGEPWFLESSPYCSFASSSVIATMAKAAGMDTVELFDTVCRAAGVGAQCST